jgi:hypothetical protein
VLRAFGKRYVTYLKSSGNKMKLSDLSPQVIDKIKSYRWDRIIEKHEGPENWDSVLKYDNPEFMVVNGYNVLLPVGQDHHPNIIILRCIIGDNGRTLTLFLKDTTYVDNPDEEILRAGFVAICDKVPGEEFYVAILYHEWFIIPQA